MSNVRKLHLQIKFLINKTQHYWFMCLDHIPVPDCVNLTIFKVSILTKTNTLKQKKLSV